MAGGTKRLPRAVREQQMLDAAVEMFSINGYHETSMDVIAAKAEISKPMLYLYYGSKEELFGACLDREMTRFIDGVREDINLEQSPKDLLRNAILAFMRYIDENRASWIVMYTQATSSQAFAHTVREGRERIIALVARLLQSGTRNPGPDADFEMMAVALVGAGEAIGTRLSSGAASRVWGPIGTRPKPPPGRASRGYADPRREPPQRRLCVRAGDRWAAGRSCRIGDDVAVAFHSTSHLPLHIRIAAGGHHRQ
jgi:AcrR family transcriptional regulator